MLLDVYRYHESTGKFMIRQMALCKNAGIFANVLSVGFLMLTPKRELTIFMLYTAFKKTLDRRIALAV